MTIKFRVGESIGKGVSKKEGKERTEKLAPVLREYFKEAAPHITELRKLMGQYTLDSKESGSFTQFMDIFTNVLTNTLANISLPVIQTFKAVGTDEEGREHLGRLFDSVKETVLQAFDQIDVKKSRAQDSEEEKPEYVG